MEAGLQVLVVFLVLIALIVAGLAIRRIRRRATRCHSYVPHGRPGAHFRVLDNTEEGVSEEISM